MEAGLSRIWSFSYQNHTYREENDGINAQQSLMRGHVMPWAKL